MCPPPDPPAESTSFRNPVVLGRTGLPVGRLGIGASYGAPAASLEAAFHERGVNYFYWGSWRRKAMGDAIRNLSGQHRDRLVVALQSYSRSAMLLRWSVHRGLRSLRLERADVLILGLHNRMPSPRILDEVSRLKSQGKVRFLAISCHRRPTFREYIRDPRVDILMLRYNAVHRGAEAEVFPHLPAEGGPGVTAYTATRWGHLIDPKRTPPGERTPRASDCYRFVLSDPHVHLCMTGPRTAEEMTEALTALDRGPMTPDEIAWMRRVGDAVHLPSGLERLTQPPYRESRGVAAP